MSAIIFGVFGDDKSSANKHMKAMRKYYLCESIYKENTINSGEASFSIVQSHCDRRTLIYFDVRRNVYVALSGNVYDVKGVSGSDLLERILNAYYEFGDDFAKYLSGIFVVLIYDVPNKRMLAANDILGLQPFNFTRVKDGILFSSEAECFTKSGIVVPRLDYDSIAELFTIGFVMQDRTLLKGISHLMPNSVLQVDRGGCRQRKCSFNKADVGEGPEDWCRDINDLLRTAVVKQAKHIEAVDGVLELSLSGGLDSRIIMNYLLKNGINFKAITCDDPNGVHKDDVAYARNLSDKYGFEHDIYTKKPGLATEINRILQPVSFNLTKTKEMTGYAAEIMKGEYLERVKIRSSREAESLLRFLFTERFISGLTMNANDAASGIARSIQLESEEKRAERFFIDHLGSSFRREEPPQHRPKHLFLNYSVFPFLDTELIDYVSALPFSELSDKKLYMNMVRTYHPELLDVPSTTVDRLDSAIKEVFTSRVTENKRQLYWYLEKFQRYSPLWSGGLFTGSFKHDYEKMIGTLFTVWYDYYFENRSSFEMMKHDESGWLTSMKDKIHTS